MSEFPPCPECQSVYSYHEETAAEQALESDEGAVKDVNGKVLVNGDSVVVVKDLPVKGAPKPVKAGTKVKNIRIVDGEHNIACKIDGFGSMGLKSEFVKKA